MTRSPPYTDLPPVPPPLAEPLDPQAARTPRAPTAIRAFSVWWCGESRELPVSSWRLGGRHGGYGRRGALAGAADSDWAVGGQAVGGRSDGPKDKPLS